MWIIIIAFSIITIVNMIQLGVYAYKRFFLKENISLNAFLAEKHCFVD